MRKHFVRTCLNSRAENARIRILSGRSEPFVQNKSLLSFPHARHVNVDFGLQRASRKTYVGKTRGEREKEKRRLLARGDQDYARKIIFARRKIFLSKKLRSSFQFNTALHIPWYICCDSANFVSEHKWSRFAFERELARASYEISLLHQKRGSSGSFGLCVRK